VTCLSRSTQAVRPVSHSLVGIPTRPVIISTGLNTNGTFKGPHYIGPASTSNWPGNEIVKLKFSQSQSQSYFATDSQSVITSWCRARFGNFDQRLFLFFFFFFLKVTVLSFGGALSDERSGLSFVSLQSVYSSLSVFT
jgi:hypothetical protein